MLRTLGVVQACFADLQARAKAQRRLNGKAILERVVRRVTDCTRLNGVIVVTDSAPESVWVKRHVPSDVPVHVGRQPDDLRRLLGAVDEYPAEAVVLVQGDAPFVDPGLIDRLVSMAESHPENDYFSYGSHDGRPALLSSVGVYAEWFRTAALRRLARRRLDSPDRSGVTSYIHSHPEKFRPYWIPAPAQIDRDDVRLSVAEPEDWEHATAILEALGSEEFDWQRIADLLDHQPDLRQRMRALNRAHAPR